MVSLYPNLPFISTELLVDILLFMVVFLIVHYAMQKMLRNNRIALVIAFVVSLLVLNYSTWRQLDFLSLTYGYTGMIMLLAIPFAVVFFFLYTSNVLGAVRKLIWIAYGSITWVLWNNTQTVSTELTTLFLTIFTGIIIAMIVFDQAIKNKMNAWKNLKK